MDNVCPLSHDNQSAIDKKINVGAYEMSYPPEKKKLVPSPDRAKRLTANIFEFIDGTTMYQKSLGLWVIISWGVLSRSNMRYAIYCSAIVE